MDRWLETPKSFSSLPTSLIYKKIVSTVDTHQYCHYVVKSERFFWGGITPQLTHYGVQIYILSFDCICIVD